MTVNSLAARLLVVAGKRKSPKKAKKKYAKDVENALDAIQEHVDTKMDYGQNTRVFRLLMRLKNALTSEGYRFTPTNPERAPLPSLGSSAPARLDSPGGEGYVVCTGALCTLLKSRVPAGLTEASSEMLSSRFQSKQCYRFTLKPADKKLTRKSGKNTALPKPVTWPRAESYGMEKSSISSSDGSLSMEEFRIDGIRVYTLDHKTFYASNVGMCKRWCSGLNRILTHAIEK